MNDISQFTEFKQLQSGTFATVWRCRYIKTGKIYAIKVLPYTNKCQRRVAMNEIYINSLLNHPYIVKMHASFINDERIYLVFDYYRKGDTFENSPISASKIPIYIKQVIQALRYCHTKGVIHRDLKPENILISGNGIAICDFGYARKVDPRKIKETKMKHKVGTPRFMSPEISMCRDLKNKNQYDYLTDIWSLGGLIADWIYIDKNYDLNNDFTCFLKISQGIWPKKKISETYKDFIEKCLRINASERISFDNMLQHPLLLNIP